MSTSLSQQLSRLAVPQTNALILSKTQPSLLFDLREATNFDKDTFHCIGLNGLEELALIDSKFKAFESTLFSDSSKFFQRAVQSETVNLKLDENIENFLYLLSPYVLTRPAQKTLEWLIYRFQIHLFNTNSLLMCVFPYHSSNLFVRIIQLLDFKNSPQWEWLRPVQSSGVPLGKMTIITYSIQQPGFLKLICNEAIKLLKDLEPNDSEKYNVLTSFYATTIGGTFRYSKQITEEMMTAILPFILQGFKSDNPSLVYSSLMIVNELFMKAQLSERLLNTLMKIICEQITLKKSEGLKCLISLYQNQSWKDIPEKSYLQLLSVKSLPDSLKTLSDQYDCKKFVFCLLTKALEFAFTSHSKAKTLGKKLKIIKEKKFRRVSISSFRLIQNLLSTIILDVEEVRSLLRQIFKVYLKEHKKKKQKHYNQLVLLRKLISFIELKYAQLFDEIMDDVLDRFALNKRLVIQNVILASLQAVDEPDEKHIGNTGLLLNLSHPNKTRRIAAASKFVEMHHSIKKKDAASLQSVLIDRLNDDCHQVIKKLISKPKILCEFISPATLISIFSKLLGRNWKTEKASISRLIVKILTCQDFFQIIKSEEEQNDIINLIIPSLFPSSLKEISETKTLLKSYIFQNVSVFQDHFENVFCYMEKVDSDETLVTLNCLSSKALIDFILEHFKGNLRNMVQKLIEVSVISGKQQYKYHFIVCLIMLMLIKNKSFETNVKQFLSFALKINKEFLTLYEQKLSEEKMDLTELENLPFEKLMTNWLQFLRKGKFPSSVAILLLENIIKCTSVPSELSDPTTCWVSEMESNSFSSEWLSLHLEFFDFILGRTRSSLHEHKHTFQQFIKLFLQHVLPNKNSLIKFLSLFWLQEKQLPLQQCSISLESQVYSLNIAVHVFNNCTKKELHDIDWEIVFPLLLIPLCCSHQPVRKLALDCISAIYQLNLNKNPYSNLARELHNTKSQLEVDRTLLGQVFEIGIASKHLIQNKKKYMNCSQDLEALINYILNPSVSEFLKANILEITQTCSSEDILPRLHPLIEEKLNKLDSSELSIHEGTVLKNLLNHFSFKISPLFQKNSSLFETFMRALNSSRTLQGHSLSPQHVTLHIVTKEFFCALSPSLQQRLFNNLISIKVNCSDNTITALLNSTLKRISMDSSLFLKELENLYQTCSMEMKSKTDKNDIHLNLSQNWQRGIIILEILCNKKKLKSVHILIPALFQLLKTRLKIENRESTEYIEQLLLSSIYHCLNKLLNGESYIPVDVLSENDVDIDAVVQCLRLSSDPETHRCTLILINLLAKIFHESVLHNIVNIFTFMGTSLLRQDDQYKFKLMEETLRAVVPIIFQSFSSEKKKTGVEQLIITILHVFVDAFNDIPNHRRRVIFMELLNLLGASEFLWIAVALMIDFQVTHELELKSVSGEKEAKKTPETMSSSVRFILELCLQYSPSTQIRTATFLLQYLSNLPKEKAEKSKNFVFSQKQSGSLKDSHGIFDVGKCSAKQFRYFKISLIAFISSLLNSSSFIHKLTDLNDEDKIPLKELYKCLIEETVQLCNKAIVWNDEFKLKSTAKFWRVFLHKTYDVLDKINSLLPNKMFFEVILMLLTNKNPSIHSKALELLISRLQHQTQSLTEEEYCLLTSLFKPLLRNLEIKSNKKLEDVEPRAITNVQNTLLCFKIISRLMGHHHLEALKEVLRKIVECFIANSSQSHICANSILTLMELCNCLKAHSIPFFHQFMPHLMNILQDTERLDNEELLLLSVVTGINKLVEILPHFLSPYLEIIITQICLLSSMKNLEINSPLSTKLRTLQQNIAAFIPARVLLPIIKSSFEALTEHRLHLSALMSVFNACVAKIEKNDVTVHLLILEPFFIQILDDCTEHHQLFSSYVDNIMEPILTFVMKMSEFSFRPFFFKLYHWAVHSDTSKERLILFYSLVNKLADKLKSLFALFAGPIMKDAVDILNNNSTLTENFYFKNSKKGRKKITELLKLVLDSLKKIFTYMNKDAVDHVHFENLVQPLADQIENEIGTDEEYTERNNEYLCPCIGQFCLAANSDVIWKQINYQILLKTRNSSPQIRITSVLILKEVCRRLQNDYLALLPETIPFLAELMEDDSSEVEQECRAFIEEIESDLGESLQKYF